MYKGSRLQSVDRYTEVAHLSERVKAYRKVRRSRSRSLRIPMDDNRSHTIDASRGC